MSISLNNKPRRDSMSRVSSLAKAGQNIVNTNNYQIQPNFIVKSPLYKNESESNFKSNNNENL
jgi:hypothetical protein